MKTFYFFIFLFFSTTSFAQNDPSSTKEEAPLVIVEEPAEYIGGQEAMVTFIQKNIKYPKKERRSNITGTCYITFIIEKDGSISGAKVLRGVPSGSGCDKEAIRVIKKMPKWKPGKQNGKKVRVQMTLPIKFKLN